MRVITVNVNGIRAAAKKGFFDWLASSDADFVCVQESKAQVEQLTPESLFFPANYYCEYFDAEKKGYSGVAIYAKHKPLSVSKGMGFSVCDTEGRYIQFDYPKYSVISLYLPSGSSGDARQAVKYEFLERFESHLINLQRRGKEIILCGDFNIVHKEIDIKNWKSNQKNSGCLPEERAWLDKLFGELGFVDAFREVNQEAGQYTWWSNRGQAWAKNVGWRIDYQAVTSGLRNKVESAEIYKQQRFSDHAPLTIDYAWPEK